MTDQIRPDRGKHLAVCRSIQFQAPKEQGKSEQVVIGFELTDANDPDFGTFTSYFGSLSPAAIGHTVKALGAIGWTGDDLAELPGLAESGALAEEVELVVDHEEYDGKWRAKVKWVNQRGGGKIKLDRPIEGADLGPFAARMKAHVRAARGSSGSSGSTQRQAAPQGNRSAAPPARSSYGNGGGRGGFVDDRPPPDDDIPF